MPRAQRAPRAKQPSKKILIVGDSPLIKTGFGRVNHHAAKAFLAQGWEVASVTALQDSKREDDLGIKQFVPKPNDQLGLRMIVDVIQKKKFEPDLIYATCEPGTLTSLARVIPARIPTFAYVPIEGEPIVPQSWRNTLSSVDFMTCSKYGADVVAVDLQKQVDWVYHGVDHTTFNPLSQEDRDAYRKRLKWDDKFVVICVAQNVRRKQWGRLFEAIAMLKQKYHQKDILLYAHVVPFQNHWLDGWNLPEISRAFGIYDEVIFNPLLSGFGKSIPETGDLRTPGLRELMGASDLFVLPSQVEGFGLPIAEAMACGIPVAVTKYAAGWEVARPAEGYGLPVADWEIYKNGTRYANIAPDEIAKAILTLKKDPKRRERMSKAGLLRVQDFQWSAFEEKVVEEAKENHSRIVATPTASGDISPYGNG